MLTSKDSELSSYFDKSGGNPLDEDQNKIVKQILIINHDDAANKVKIKGQLALEHTFVFGKVFKKITKILGLHLTFETSDLQDIIYTTKATDINVTINSFYFFRSNGNSIGSNSSYVD